MPRGVVKVVPYMPKTLTTERELATILDSVTLAGEAAPAKLYVELGTRKAGTAARVRKRLIELGRKAHILGVDKDPTADAMWRKAMGDDLAAEWTGITWSFHVGTTDSALADRSPASIAWVLVDACHCFECASADIEQWSRLVAPGGVLVAHDTTPRRKHYTKHFQHGGKRPFGSWQAAEAAEADGGALSTEAGWRKVWDVDDRNGVRVYQKEAKS